MHEEDYRPIDDFLQRFVDRLRRVQGLEALCLAGTVLAVLAALGMGVDAIKQVLPYAPLVFSLLSIVSLLVVTGVTLLRFLRSRSLSWAARAIEGQRPGSSATTSSARCSSTHSSRTRPGRPPVHPPP